MTEPAVQTPATADTRPRRPGVSVRTRLTVTMSVLTCLALLAAGVVIWTLESSRRDVAVVDDANQQIAELRAYAETHTDPATGSRFTSAEEVLRAFMSRNLPGPDEMMALWSDGAASLVTVSSRRKVVREAAVVDAVSSLSTDGGSDRVTTSRGEVLLTVQPVTGTDGVTASLVVLTFLEAERRSLQALVQTYIVVALLALLLVTGIAAWQSRRLLLPLRRLSETTREISGSDLSRRVPESGNDDLTELTRTVNDMLERLDAAFSGQRQFLDDAGHELRTPLTVLGGHLELMNSQDPDEVETTRVLLLDEVERMSRLVDDLILLAKSRRPDFVHRGPIDLDDLTASVLAKARPIAQRVWEIDAAAPIQVSVDAQRITQAWLQLVDNAVKHTGEGDTIALGSSVSGDRGRIWVRDTGDGIAPEDHAVVLERFGRSAVRPGDEGFGLGLSIVSAIAEAHGGKVLLEETPGGGATVIVEFDLEETPWPAS